MRLTRTAIVVLVALVGVVYDTASAWPTQLARHKNDLVGIEVIGGRVYADGVDAGICVVDDEGVATLDADLGDWRATWRLRPGDYAVATASDGESVHLGEWDRVVSLRLYERLTACVFILLGLSSFWLLLVCMWRRAVTP